MDLGDKLNQSILESVLECGVDSEDYAGALRDLERGMPILRSMRLITPWPLINGSHTSCESTKLNVAITCDETYVRPTRVALLSHALKEGLHNAQKQYVDDEDIFVRRVDGVEHQHIAKYSPGDILMQVKNDVDAETGEPLLVMNILDDGPGISSGAIDDIRRSYMSQRCAYSCKDASERRKRILELTKLTHKGAGLGLPSVIMSVEDGLDGVVQLGRVDSEVYPGYSGTHLYIAVPFFALYGYKGSRTGQVVPKNSVGPKSSGPMLNTAQILRSFKEGELDKLRALYEQQPESRWD